MFKTICILLTVALVFPAVSPLNPIVNDSDGTRTDDLASVESLQTDHRYVLAELGSTSWCPNCPRADAVMKTVYGSGTLPFYYMTLVYDLNDAASKRGSQLMDSYIPMLYIDGGYSIVDSVSELNYANAIADALDRDSKDVSLTMQAQWNETNSIQISLDIINNGGSASYFYNVRICIVEINSRWTDQDGINYSYALMDYALNTYAFTRDTKSMSVTWDNTMDMHEGNTMVLAYVAHWFPHLQKNPWTEPKPFRFLAQFVDNVCAVEL
jgi:hypothetical protein